jgi:hypothetical protein
MYVLVSIETLLGNIQGLLKVTSDNVRMVERQILVDRGMSYQRRNCSYLFCAYKPVNNFSKLVKGIFVEDEMHLAQTASDVAKISIRFNILHKAYK